MATGTLRVDGGSLTDNQIMSTVGVHLMATGAGNLVFHVTALEAADLGVLIQVTSEADLVGGGSGELSGIPNSVG
jgi:hypothetical protein